MDEMQKQKEMEEMKEFLNMLTEVKVSLAELNGKVDQITNMKETVEETAKVAQEVQYKAAGNEKDISDLKTKVDEKASRHEVQRVIKERENWLRNLPAWVASIIAFAALFLQFLIP
ncbi:hypothetical protein [Salibacterium lacus]|uniref:Uncharacterized protein n=1 Tax=Salibacterium lacus TaxID=1898109 RepID=A0ABW5SYJ7_9BACI